MVFDLLFLNFGFFRLFSSFMIIFFRLSEFLKFFFILVVFLDNFFCLLRDKKFKIDCFFILLEFDVFLNENIFGCLFFLIDLFGVLMIILLILFIFFKLCLLD